MTQDFFPKKDYKVPETSNYMKIIEGENTFRIMSSAVIGYEYFDNENNPHRSREPFDEMPNSKEDQKHFWAFVVWNRQAKKIQMLEITQKTVMNPIKSLIDNPKWGSPVNRYDITITRKGTTKNDTEYSVMPNPAEPNDKEMEEAFKKTPVNLDALFIEGGEPFKTSPEA